MSSLPWSTFCRLPRAAKQPQRTSRSAASHATAVNGIAVLRSILRLEASNASSIRERMPGMSI